MKIRNFRKISTSNFPQSFETFYVPANILWDKHKIVCWVLDGFLSKFWIGNVPLFFFAAIQLPPAVPVAAPSLNPSQTYLLSPISGGGSSSSFGGSFQAPSQSFQAPSQSYAVPSQSYGAPALNYHGGGQQSSFASGGSQSFQIQAPVQAAPSYHQGSSGGFSGGFSGGNAQSFAPAASIVQKHIYGKLKRFSNWTIFKNRPFV